MAVSELTAIVDAVRLSTYRLLIDPLMAPMLLVVIWPVEMEPEFTVLISAS